MGLKLKKDEVVYKGCYGVRQVLKEAGGFIDVTVDGANFRVPTKVKTLVSETVPVLVKLRLPKGTRVSQWPTGRGSKLQKSRADRAVVMGIVDRDGRRYTEAFSKHNNNFKYYAGEDVKPDRFNPDKTFDCSNGLHFYRGEEKAWHWVRG